MQTKNVTVNILIIKLNRRAGAFAEPSWIVYKNENKVAAEAIITWDPTLKN